ncbi:MAG: 2-oxoacid:acceptor oxidoreductase family protein [Deltaproteobacteria bacterium]|nr:2-oxoacid:acceptor oxidoreductase family protein [Deltaproteobacteria bacterium]
MIEIMFQGHGGHGSVVAAKLLAQAAAKSGFHAQSFASYGALRRGGKVEGYVRISDNPLLLRCKMYESDYLVLMDEALIEESGGHLGIKEKGKVLLNTSRPISDYPALKGCDAFTVDAYGIAIEKGLVIPGGMPVINTTLLGALAGMLKEVPVDDLIDAIRESTPKPDKNAECAMEGYRNIIGDGKGDVSQGSPAGEEAPGRKPMGRFPVHHPEKMSKCERCMICYMACPTLAISFEADPWSMNVNRERCTGCGICIEECPRDAISWEGQTI